MSAIYNLEPQPTASAIIHTTLGEILVELFAKQTPLTCRNFLQLSLDGYYDGTIFHRLVPNFILQGGDPTGTGNGGESIYDGGAFGGDLDPWPMDQRHGKNAGPTGINFRDEFHSRLKFNRRGLLAMANEGHIDTNGSQFFFTLDKTDELNGKNTLFGRVAGDTIYNLAKIGESEVEEGTDRPMYAVKIERVEILVNPFEDMKKRTRVATHVQKKPVAKEKKKRKAGKQLLSFGDDEDDNEVLSLPKKAKFDTRIIMDDGSAEEPPKEKSTKSKVTKTEKTVSLESKGGGDVGDTIEPAGQPLEVKTPFKEEDSDDESSSEIPKKTALQIANEEMAALKASMRRNIHTAKDEAPRKKSTLASMIPETSIRGARKRPVGGSGVISSDDQATLKLLKGFQSRLDKAPPGKAIDENDDKDDGEVKQGQIEGDDEAELCDLHFIANCQSCTSWDKQEKEESDDEGWMSHTLSFAADKLGKDLSNRKKAEEELVVIDPRSKEHSMREEKRAKRDARSGGSGREWDQRRDQARNARMSQAASLAGRGAK
ncbi:peptidyl-prolyl isomerase CWC27 [Cordyceps javanica]|uniref:peptidylprolyl isomerase n=1 Tax=Cordyceps javanica TaxID=43265 RepID=A0A545V8I9_9HYPO|nr:peptidyl-prolyl isomerase CWC27 [Cordyceps javanica]TQW08786.1 peptidyl-prolyl isomerase CWC27 [Cordyceps javanica]